MRGGLAAVVVGGVAAGCTPPAPRAIVAGASLDVAAFVAAHRPGEGQGIRVDEVLRTPAASAHVVQAREPESPHRHRRHDLTVTVLRGGGVLHVDDRALPMRAGDVAVVDRGRLHWFAPAPGDPAIALAVFAPPFDGVDVEPAAPPR